MNSVEDVKDVKPASNKKRYRLYIDESGDHNFHHLELERHRYLCLFGCWFHDESYEQFHNDLQAIKKDFFGDHIDERVILHREDIVRGRGGFECLKDKDKRTEFDTALLKMIEKAEFKAAAITIDKLSLKKRYVTPDHPYHLAMKFLLQRYCGFLSHSGCRGDVMAEARGAQEDMLLKGAYERVYNYGIWIQKGDFFKNCLTSKELKVKQKAKNISGLQLADILAAPARREILALHTKTAFSLSEFESKIMRLVNGKYCQKSEIAALKVVGRANILFP